jgi:hypothetical protein
MNGARCVERIPDVEFVRAELARNVRERSLLQKLLKLAERKAIIARLNESQEREVRHDA